MRYLSLIIILLFVGCERPNPSKSEALSDYSDVLNMFSQLKTNINLEHRRSLIEADRPIGFLRTIHCTRLDVKYPNKVVMNLQGFFPDSLFYSKKIYIKIKEQELKPIRRYTMSKSLYKFDRSLIFVFDDALLEDALKIDMCWEGDCDEILGTWEMSSLQKSLDSIKQDIKENKPTGYAIFDMKF